MKDLITAIDEKFGNTAELVIHMDLSGHVSIENYGIAFFFDNILEVKLSDIDSIEYPVL